MNIHTSVKAGAALALETDRKKADAAGLETDRMHPGAAPGLETDRKRADAGLETDKRDAAPGIGGSDGGADHTAESGGTASIYWLRVQ